MVRLLLILSMFFSALVSAENIVLVAEKKSPILKKLIDQLSQLAPDFSYQISTAEKPITIHSDDYAISVGAQKVTDLNISKHARRIAVMLTANQAQTMNVATSIFIEPSLSRQLKLADLLIPGNKKLGLLVSSNQDRDKVLMTLTDAEKMMLKVVNIEDYESINQALFHVLKDTRLLLGSYNNEIYNAKNIKNILITSYRQKKVLVGPSRAYLKAGSFATTFSDLSHIARRIIEIIQYHQEHGKWLKAGYNPYYRILFNSQVARSLNIHVLDNVVLRKKMGDVK